MLEDLFENNKLEYICIIKDYNIVKKMTISKNIQSLNCFYVDNEYHRVNITLDITNEYPDQLSVFTVLSDYDVKHSGIITGPEDKV